MKGLKTTRRLIAAVLSLVMVLGMLPVIPLNITAATTGETNFVSLPITIRDYASDGMLFECNDMNYTGVQEMTYTTGTAGHELFRNRALGSSWADTLSSATDYPFTITRSRAYDSSVEDTRAVYATPANSAGLQIRYVALKYSQTSVQSGMAPMLQYYSGNTLVANVPLNWNCNGTVHTVVVDMGAHNTNITQVKFRGNRPKGATTTIYWAQGFATYEEAQAYNDAGGKIPSTSVNYNQNNNLGFGLLATSDASKVNNLTATNNSIPGTELILSGGYNSSADPGKQEVTLSTGAVQTIHGAYIRTNLVENTLDAQGRLVYTQATVAYLADYLKQTLPLDWAAGTDTYNMAYVMGSKVLTDKDGNKIDLAMALRNQLSSGTMGDYQTAKDKFNAGNLTEYTDVTTYYEAAYYLLHNLFADNQGYGQTVDAYNTLNLVQNGDGNYVFNSAYDDVIYDTENGKITNSQITTITQRKFSDTGNLWYSRGHVMPANCFNPVMNMGYGLAASSATYNDILGGKGLTDQNDTNGNSYYDSVNFHYVLEGHAQFIYHADDSLFFTFTGDDDVYLFINGVRVLDLGGAHAISRATINLNDVAAICGLSDGEIYTFDFYYMERHGTSANFGIETNIKIVDPSMITEKRAWQNDNLVGYNGYVLPNTDIVYDFSITNNGETSIGDLTFLDETLGVSLSKDAIVLPDGTSINDIAAYHFAADGSVKAFTNPANMDEDTLKSYLAAETAETKLQVGEKLLVYGFKHRLGNNDADTFDNYVYTTAVADGENVDDAKRNLNGMDNHRVQMTTFAFESLEFYDGGRLSGEGYGLLDEDKSMGITITRDELLAPMKAKEELKNLDYSNATIALTNASGTSTNVKYNATVNADGSIFFETDKTGTELFYYAVTIGGDTYEPIAVHVHTYGVADSIFVLDYNLPVELYSGDYSLIANDVLALNSNAGTGYHLNGCVVKDASEDLCGTFAVSDGSIKYTMNKFMNNVDSIEVTVSVLAKDAIEVTKTTGVTMTQTVTVVPANVMYYEDDFTGDGAITYVNTGSDVSGNIWAVYTGENVGTEQSADQDMNYGFDPNYDRVQSSNLLFNAGYFTDSSLAADVLADIDPAINEKYGEINGYLGGNASNDTLHVLKVNNAKSANVMSFGFTGTGFEIVSRTTTYAYAVLTVKIERLNNEGKWETYKVIPVITECIGGDLAQIPVIARKDMPYGQYQVTVSTSNMNGFDRAFYVDGIRIYQPLTDAQEALYYKADEANVTFTEIKTSIKNENIIYGTISPSMAESEIPTEITRWQYGTTMIEDQSGSFVLSQTEAYDTYMSYGPNNEIYLNTSDGGSLAYIAFYVTEDASYTGERSIQVGAHLKKTTDNEVEDDPLLSVSLVYGGSSFNFGSSDYTYSVVSGTEQYYSINTDCLKFENDPNNEGAPMRALVIIGTDDPNQNTLALTNLKLNGYSIVGEGTIADEVEAAQDESDINVSTAAAQTYALYKKYTAEN